MTPMPRHRRCAALALLSLAAACAREPGERIVLVTLDTLRWDSFAGRDGAGGSMPNLARWAEAGTVFERYYSATSTTQPTHATLFTGLHPWQHGVPFNGAVLAEEHTTLVERLRERGFVAAAAVASFPVHSRFGWGQGFAEFHDEFTRGEAEEWSGVDVDTAGFFSEAAYVVDRAIELLDAAEAPRQFFWFHLYDPHAPYGDTGGGDRGAEGKVRLTPREVGKLIEAGEAADAVLTRARRGYDRDVSYLDGELGRLLAHIEAARDRPTHVVVVSDHGESFGESQTLGHGQRLTPEQIHVPLVIRSPLLEPGRCSTPVGTLDVSATLLALAGIPELPAGGRDLTRPLEEMVVMGMRRTYDERYIERRIDGRTEVIEPDSRRYYLVEDGVCYAGGTGTVSIDDRESAPADPAQARRLQALFDSFTRDFNALGYRVLDDEETLDKLRQMGYVGDDEH
jgi:arylsulfatase A-like enzyme